MKIKNFKSTAILSLLSASIIPAAHAQVASGVALKRVSASYGAAYSGGTPQVEGEILLPKNSKLLVSGTVGTKTVRAQADLLKGNFDKNASGSGYYIPISIDLGKSQQVRETSDRSHMLVTTQVGRQMGDENDGTVARVYAAVGYGRAHDGDGNAQGLIFGAGYSGQFESTVGEHSKNGFGFRGLLELAGTPISLDLESQKFIMGASYRRYLSNGRVLSVGPVAESYVYDVVTKDSKKDKAIHSLLGLQGSVTFGRKPAVKASSSSAGK